MRHRDPNTIVARLAASLREQLDELTDEVTTLIQDNIGIYSEDALVTRTQLWSAVRQNLARSLSQLERPDTVEHESARASGRARAAQGAPLPEVLRAYRLGFAHLWQRLLDSARAAGPRETHALLDAVAGIWELNDEFANAVTEAYREEMTARAVSLDRRRSALVAALVDGTLSDQYTAWEISQLLGIPFEGPFLVVIAEVPPLEGEALLHLEERLRCRDIASAWRSQHDREIGIVYRNRRRTPEDIFDIVAGAATTRVGVSPEFDRLDRTSRAARFASVAMESLPAGTTGIRQLPDTPLSDLIISNPDNTRSFVWRVLRCILELPDNDRSTHIATARAWLDAQGSAAEAGRVLYCHENTVRYRMRRLEERLGTTLDDPLKLAELAAALQAIQAFPDLTATSSGAR
ncbi:PucR family transcriptional regulator [Nocardia sp. N2S4-5]|uniref:PucR family transcriptional regulator n=1 Tax=Nocardia sp. N2S4-5 TaxID=3351565 RepID=UPI0037D52515